MDRDIIVHIHAVLGTIVFVAGILQILLKKGGKIHIIVGQVYLYGWLLLLISGAYIGGAFITTIGIFGFYFALTGARIGHLKNKGVHLFEKAIFILGGLVALTMLFYSVNLFLKNQNSFAIIFAVFGSIFLFTTVEDIAKFIIGKPLRRQKYGKLDWYFDHLKRMFISFIAAVTAFTSIQNVFSDNTLNFLLPTAIGLVLIKLSIDKFKKKLIK